MPNLGDRVWHDADGDRLQDPGELGIAGVKLELGNLTTGVTVDMTTDANGNYLFEGLVNGQEYDLRIAASNFEEGGVLAGADITYKVGVMDGSHSVEFIMNNDADFFDFGYRLANTGPLLADLGPAVTVDEQAAVTLDLDVSVADPELDAGAGGSGNYAGAVLTVARSGGANAEDQFALLDVPGVHATGGSISDDDGRVYATYSAAGGTLTVAFTSGGRPATSALVDAVLRAVTYSNAGDNPPESVTLQYGFSDGNTGSQGAGSAKSDSKTIVVNINALNDAPEGAANAVLPDGASGAPYTIHEAHLLAGFSDPDGDALSVENLTASIGTLADNGDGTWTLTPPPTFTGEVTLNYHVSDGTASIPATQSFDIEIENLRIAFSLATAADLFGFGWLTRPSGLYLETEVSLPSGALLDSDYEHAAFGNVDTPQGFGGDLEFLNVSSVGGSILGNPTAGIGVGLDGLISGTERLSFALDQDDITGLTSPAGPVAAAAAPEDRGHLISSAVFDLSFISGSGKVVAELYAGGVKVGEQLLDITKTGWLGRDGTVRLDAGDLQFDEVRLGATGSLRFSLKDTEFETGPVPNELPVAMADSYLFDYHSGSISVDVSDGVLANDIDPEGGMLTAEIVSGPSSGALSLAANGSFVYTPGTFALINDSFTYRAFDGESYSGPVTVELAVVPTNNAPSGEAAADLPDGTEDVAYIVSAAQLLLGFSDGDGDTLSVTNLQVDQGGAIAPNANGTYTISFPANFNGEVTLSYSIADGFGGTLGAFQTFTIPPENDQPDVPADVDPGLNKVLEGAATGTTVGLTVQASDLDGDIVTYSFGTDGSGNPVLDDGRFAIDQQTGVVTVSDGSALDFDTAQSHTITVTASDGAATSEQDFTISVGASMAGHTIRHTFEAPFMGEVLSGPDDLVVGDGVELAVISPGAVPGSIDIRDDSIVFSWDTGFGLSAGFAFAGSHFSDLDDALPDIVGVTISQNNVVGVDQSDITFDADNIWVNLSGMVVGPGYQLVLEVEFA
jgi:hypothetical protein